MKRMTNCALAIAAICGALLFLGPTTTRADGSFKIRELRMVGTNEDIASDPSIAFDFEDEIFYIAFMELGPVGLLCALADFEFEEEDDDEPSIFHLRKSIAAGSFVRAQIGVTANGHSAVRVGFNGNFVANELVPSTTDSSKLEMVARSGTFAIMSDLIRLSRDGKVLFAAGAGDFGGFSSIHLSAAGASTSTPIIDDSGPFDTFYAPASNQFFSHYVFPAYLDDDTGGFWSLQNNGIATPIIDSNNGYAAFGSISVNDSGTAAFRALPNGGGELIGRFRANKVEQILNTTGSFRNFNDASINNRNEIAVYAVNDDLSGGVYFVPFSAGPSPTPVTVIKTGEALSGSTVTQAYVGTEALTDRGDIVFRASLADGREGIYLATPQRSALLSISPPGFACSPARTCSSPVSL